MNERPPQAIERSAEVWASRYGCGPARTTAGPGPPGGGGAAPAQFVRAAPVERRVVRMELELEGGRDAEVGPGAAKPPEQLRLGFFGGADDPAIGRHELDRAEGVGGQPEV